MPERRACRVLGQSRSTQRRVLITRNDEDVLTRAIVDLASEYGRYGYRRITALLRAQGWNVNHKRVERIWRREGLKVPTKQPKRARLWLNDGSCVRLRPTHQHHVWSYDFVMDRTHDGRAFRMLTVIDEHSRECLAIRTERRQNQETVLEALSDLFLLHGPPEHLRSDNGAEFTATAVREWREGLEVKTLLIKPRKRCSETSVHLQYLSSSRHNDLGLSRLGWNCARGGLLKQDRVQLILAPRVIEARPKLSE